MSKILLIVKANDCKACHANAVLLDEFINYVRTQQKIKVIEITVPSTQYNWTIQNQYPRDLERFVIWFPFVALFDKTSWDQASTSSSARLNGDVFNGQYNERIGKYEPARQYHLNMNDLKRWLDSVSKVVLSPQAHVVSPSSSIVSSGRYAKPYGNHYGYN